MRIDENLTSVVCNIENIIAKETYNPNSYNGWTCEEGCGFRYPVNYCKDKDALKKESISKARSVISDMDPDCIDTMKYKFGSNHLYIGKGIVNALAFLEERYGIDFNALEDAKRKKAKEELSTNNEVAFPSGEWVVGKDIDVGAYKLSRAHALGGWPVICVRNADRAIELAKALLGPMEFELKNGQILCMPEECFIKKL